MGLGSVLRLPGKLIEKGVIIPTGNIIRKAIGKKPVSSEFFEKTKARKRFSKVLGVSTIAAAAPLVIKKATVKSAAVGLTTLGVLSSSPTLTKQVRKDPVAFTPFGAGRTVGGLIEKGAKATGKVPRSTAGAVAAAGVGAAAAVGAVAGLKKVKEKAKVITPAITPTPAAATFTPVTAVPKPADNKKPLSSSVPSVKVVNKPSIQIKVNTTGLKKRFINQQNFIK